MIKKNSIMQIPEPEDDAVAFHFLEQGFVGGEERESHGFGQGDTVPSIVTRKVSYAVIAKERSD
ncbi:hypothetical protein [Candidatus Methylomirabilis sp.]|uniref:hypothetical protein n=1 Tax=Candidatus Methylomirabilis sp. TaxID=2032687 RepID=UPI003C712B26